MPTKLEVVVYGDGNEKEYFIDDVLKDPNEIKGVLENIVDNEDQIEIKITQRPLGKNYGNRFYEGVIFEKFCDNLWVAITYRGSIGWKIWSFGTDGYVIDSPIYVVDNVIKELIRRILDVEHSNDIIDLYIWINERVKVDYEIYPLLSDYVMMLEEILNKYVTQDCEKGKVVLLSDYEYSVSMFIDITYEVTDEDRKEFIQFIRMLKEDYEEAKEFIDDAVIEIENARTIGDIIKVLSKLSYNFL